MSEKPTTKPHHHRGWDHFTCPPGTTDSMNCPVCGEEMEVKRDVAGPTSWAEAMARGSHKHDVFSCRHYAEPWHVQIIRLEEFKLTLPSQNLRRFVEEEVAVIKTSREATVEVLPLW